VELVGRLLVSLAVVLGLLWLVARRARRGGRKRIRSGKLIDLLGRQQLSRTSSVAVIRVLDRALIVGVSEATVTVLGEVELDAVNANLAELDPTRAEDPMPASGQRSAPTSAAPSSHRSGPVSGAQPRAGREPARKRPSEGRDGALAGSALSPATWRQTVDALREMTVRRG